jgi:hypothetical protein
MMTDIIFHSLKAGGGAGRVRVDERRDGEAEGARRAAGRERRRCGKDRGAVAAARGRRGGVGPPSPQPRGAQRRGCRDGGGKGGAREGGVRFLHLLVGWLVGSFVSYLAS